MKNGAVVIKISWSVRDSLSPRAPGKARMVNKGSCVALVSEESE